MTGYLSVIREKEIQQKASEEIIDQFMKRNIKLEKKIQILSNIIADNKIDYDYSSYGGNDDDNYDDMI